MALGVVGAHVTGWTDPSITSAQNSVNTLTAAAGVAGGMVLSGSLQGPAGYTGQGNVFRGSGFWATRKSLSLGRSDFPAIAYGDGYVYLSGGTDANGNVIANMTQYDAVLHQYTELPPLLTARTRHQTVALIGDVVYLVGGYTDNAQSVVNECLEMYNLTKALAGASNHSTQGPCKMLTARSDHCIGAIGTKVIVAGGYDSNYNILNSTEIFETNPGAVNFNKWVYGAPMPTPRGDVMCSTLNDLLYVVGGFYNSVSDGGPLTPLPLVGDSPLAESRPRARVSAARSPPLPPFLPAGRCLLPRPEGCRQLAVGERGLLRGHQLVDLQGAHPAPAL